MGQLLAVAKAANKLGISRHELQALIRSGKLHTFEGQLDIDELQDRYPTMSIDDEPMLERVKNIKSTAFGRRVQQRIAPEKDNIETLLKRKTFDLDMAKEEAKRYREIIEEMAQLLQTGQQSRDEIESEVHRQLSHWLAMRLHN